jgi:peptidoglycan hydrolase-like protein with peptidoglycan-binding domain
MIVAFASPGSHASLVSSEGPANVTKPLQPATALQLVSVSPAAGAKGVNGTRSVRVRFSQPLSPNSPMPTLSPSIAGHWAVQGNTAVFTPAVGWLQKTKVTVKIPGGLAGVVSAEGSTAGDGGTLGSDLSPSFTTASFSNMRLQELMAQLGYLPMTFKATSGPAVGATNARAQLAAAYRAPAGTFTWHSGWPWALKSQWKPGKANILQVGAIRAFESVHKMTMDGIAGKALWSKLITAVAKVQKNPNGYTYALANQHYPEKITIWHNGKGGAHQPGQHRHPGPLDRGRHLPRVPEVLLHVYGRHQPGRVEVPRPGVLRELLQRRRRGARVRPGQLRVLPEPGLRRAALVRGQEGVRLPLLRQPGHGDRTGGLSFPG